MLIIYYQDHFLLKSLSVWSVFLFFSSCIGGEQASSAFQLNKQPIWTVPAISEVPYSCISRPPFLSTKIRFFIISGQRDSIQTDRDFPKVNLLFLGMYWRHRELKNCRAQCNRVLWSLSALVYITTT